MPSEDKRHITDENLLQLYRQSGDSKWLGTLLQRYTLLLVGVGMKYLNDAAAAEDCVQQVFIKAIDYLPHHRVDHLKGWLYAVMRNECLMQIRRHKVSITSAMDTELLEDLIADDVATAQEKERKMVLLEKSLALLPQAQKDCLRLFYLEKKTYFEIAEQTGLLQNQVKSHIQNGKRNLKIWMEKHTKDE